MVTEPPQWRRLKAAAEYLDVDERTIRNWISAGRLPAYKMSKQIRIKQSDLDALLKPIPAGQH